MSFWEPIYNPQEREPFPVHNWNFKNTAAPKHVSLTSDGLKEAVRNSSTSKFSGLRFLTCDFWGMFDLGNRDIVFRDCTFEDCDFGVTTWVGAKFTDCNFIKSSFTQSVWRMCEFRSCIWEDIGISGNETQFFDTVITNPGKFIAAACTNKSQLPHDIDPFYQSVRLESSKATLARFIMRMLQNTGSEDSYYEAVKTSSNQSTLAIIYQAIYELKHGRIMGRLFAAVRVVLSCAEYVVLNFMGSLNGWGRSVGRPAGIGAFLTFLFATIYSVSGCSSDIWRALLESVEITLLIGYTEYANQSLPLDVHLIIMANMVIGLLWYIVFVPTVLNRISKVR